MEGIVQSKKNIGLIFTMDYEIHGNGSGIFEDYAYFPIKEMLNIFDKYGAKLTIMAEMGYYWAMQKYPNIFQKDINLFQYQLRDAIKRGHDVQLHLHPQWFNANYKYGKWNVPFNKKSIARLCNSYEDSIKYLKKGKEDLEQLLKPINPNYECIGFRAGFFQMQPSIKILKAMSEVGFLSDTSVSKGIFANDELRNLDYTKAYSSYMPWKINLREIEKRSEESCITEFPVCCSSSYIPGRILKYFEDLKLSNLTSDFSKKILEIKKENTLNNKIMKMSKKYRNIFKKRYRYLDFCLNTSSDFLRSLKKIQKKVKKKTNFTFIPIVVMGHSKHFSSPPNLRAILKELSNCKNISIENYRDAINKYNNVKK